MRTGVFWPDPGRTYPPGTPLMERVVCFADRAREYHLENVADRVRRLRANNPTAVIYMRVDYRVGISLPRDAAERAEYYGPPGDGKLAWVLAWDEMAQVDVWQQGNEPQLEGKPNWTEIADSFNGPGRLRTFHERVRSYRPHAQVMPAPIAPYNEEDLGAPAAPAALEDSPWGRLGYWVPHRILANASSTNALPSGWAYHAYGDPDPSDPVARWEPLRQVLSDDGHRFGINVAETWETALARAEAEFDTPTLPRHCTETDTAARWEEGDDTLAPERTYVGDWLMQARGALASYCPPTVVMLWFTADSAHHDGAFPDFALHERTGALAAADDNFAWLAEERR